jgi:hypothetical protein
MDGKHRDTSMRLVLASVPLQALMMVGAAGLLFGGASTSPAPGQDIQVYVQPGPGGGPATGIVLPVEACPAIADGPGIAPSGWTPGASASRHSLACASPYYWVGTDKAPDVAYMPGPCCGG